MVSRNSDWFVYKEMTHIKNNSFKLISSFGIVVSFIFMALLGFFNLALDLYKISSKTIYTPVLNIYLYIPMVLIFIFPILNLLIIELLDLFNLTINRDSKLFPILNLFNISSIISFVTFLIMIIIPLNRIYNQWIKIGALSWIGR